MSMNGVSKQHGELKCCFLEAYEICADFTSGAAEAIQVKFLKANSWQRFVVAENSLEYQHIVSPS